MNISILGCGWLGLPLAKRLKGEGYSVKGSTTRGERIVLLRNEGIIPYKIRLCEEGIQGDVSEFLKESHILIIDIPPGLRNNASGNFLEKIGRLKDFIVKSPGMKVLFVSSTSVYEDTSEFPVYTEKNAPNGTSNNAVQLIGVEEMLSHQEQFKTTVLRFGGLIGPGRHPVHVLSGRKAIKDPAAPVNLIQQEDCIGIIVEIIKTGAWGEKFNAAYPKHPSKADYYTRQATEKNLALPRFELNSVSRGKIIESTNLSGLLKYSFKKMI